MSEARVERVHSDRVLAREFLAQARTFLSDAQFADLSAPSRAVLLHNAAVGACDAILQACGLRVTSGDRAHVLRLETALSALNGDTEELLEDLDASRARRNEASYAAGFISQASVVDAQEATLELVARAEAFLAG